MAVSVCGRLLQCVHGILLLCSAARRRLPVHCVQRLRYATLSAEHPTHEELSGSAPGGRGWGWVGWGGVGLGWGGGFRGASGDAAGLPRFIAGLRGGVTRPAGRQPRPLARPGLKTFPLYFMLYSNNPLRAKYIFDHCSVRFSELTRRDAGIEVWVLLWPIIY